MPFPQFQLKVPIHTIFTTYVENHRGARDVVDFATDCLVDGAHYIRSNNDYVKAVGLVEKIFKENVTKQVFYNPTDAFDFESFQRNLINSHGITSKRMLVRESAVWFLESKKLISIGRETIAVLPSAQLVRNETRTNR